MNDTRRQEAVAALVAAIESLIATGIQEKPANSTEIIMALPHSPVVTVEKMADWIGLRKGIVQGWLDNPSIEIIQKVKIGKYALINVDHMRREL